MSNPEQEELELEAIQIEEYLHMGEALLRLEKNPDFMLVITEGYLKQKALNSMSMLAVPAIKKRGERPELMEDLISISNLNYHFAMIKNFHEGAIQTDHDDVDGSE